MPDYLERYPPSDEKFDNEDSNYLLGIEDNDHDTEALPPQKKTFLQNHLLSALCLTLHLVLILLHIVALISAVRHWEHRFTFAIDDQATVSFWVTVSTQTFGTAYSAILVFLTQKLAKRRNFGPNRTLTAIKDDISAWAGLGSAFVSLWNQLSVPASVCGTLSIVGYLSCISILHISIPAIISVEVFNATVNVPATTLGIPEYVNTSVINSTRNYMTTFAVHLLPFRGLFDDSQMLGLLNGSLHEVLRNTTSAKGTAHVSAFGFNISCGYVPARISNVNPVDIDVLVNGLPGSFTIYAGNPYLMSNSLRIYQSDQVDETHNSIYLSTTTVVVDSQGNLGAPLIFAQQPTAVVQNLTNFDLSSSQIQFLKCSKSIVPQFAIIDATSNNILDGSLSPSIYKNYSTWVPAAELDFASQSSTLLGGGLWSEIVSSIRDPIGSLGTWAVNE
ncbi:hypothetical protein C8R45DRAFT_1175809 [Mycena sanguinolenta]|nr:hypothetical protein C8R45DRAFT_1175809 [Mycena sanguinolenta]